MAFIKTLKDSNNNTIYPQSLTSAVVDFEGNSLETIHRQFITATGMETEIEDINIGFERVDNKIKNISELATDEQYPSAKAVYDYVNNLQIDVNLDDYAKKNELPTKVSQLTNDSNFITKETESDPTVPNYVKSITEENINNWNSKIDLATLDNNNYIKNAVTSPMIIKYFWYGTQDEYNALTSIDANTEYNIIEE